MEIEAAEALTDLFQQRAENRELDYRTARLSVDTLGRAEISITNITPIETARHLRHLLTTQNGLHQRFRLDNGIPAPIMLQINGRYRHETLDKEYGLEPALVMRFMEEADPSNVLINYDTIWSPDKDSRVQLEGPSLKAFIHILERAGSDWSNIYFTESAPTQPSHLRLVKG